MTTDTESSTRDFWLLGLGLLLAVGGCADPASSGGQNEGSTADSQIDSTSVSSTAVSADASTATGDGSTTDDGPTTDHGAATSEPTTTTEGDPTIPTWVPDPGEVVSFTTGGAVVINRFADVTAPYYSSFFSIKIVNDYSSAIANPHLGTHGGLLYFGGGHAGTNDNGVMGLIFARETMEFARLADPSPYFGSGTDENTRTSNGNGNVMSLLDPTFGDSLPAVEDQPKPAANHTYGHGDVVPPGNGGATHGTFFSPFVTAGPAANGDNFGGAHTLEINSLIDPALNVWARASAIDVPRTSLMPPVFSAYSPADNRSYFMSRNVESATRWFDHDAADWGGSGPGLNVGGADDPDGGALIHVPERELLVAFARVGGELRVQYTDVSAAAPAAVGTAPLSQVLDLRDGGAPDYATWHSAFWCPDNDRLIVGNVMMGDSPDVDAVYELEIPATLGGEWVVTRQPFVSGTLPWPVTAWQNLSYVPTIKAAVVMFYAADVGEPADTIFVFRPHGT